MRATIIKANAPPARSIAFWAIKAHRGRFLFVPSKEGHPLEREGIERRKGAGAQSHPGGAPLAKRTHRDARSASAPKWGARLPALYRGIFTSPGSHHEPLPNRGALLRALSQPDVARSRVMMPAGRARSRPGCLRCKLKPAGSAAPASADWMPLEGALSEPGWTRQYS